VTWKGWEDYAPPPALANAPKAKRSKYGAEPTTVDGHRFDSKREANRYVELVLDQRGGAISDLQLQQQFALHVVNDAGVKVCVGRYIADFSYYNTRSGKRVIEDAKGHRTALYKWKKKHVEAEYGVLVVEV
jgi:hypothetical protein